MNILIVEDNEILSKNLSRYLTLKWFNNKKVISAEDAESFITTWEFDFMILDLNLPWKDWLTYCRELREKWNNIPIIILTSSDTHEDVILWLNSWADDYIAKPFDYEELIARINAISKRIWLTKKLNNIHKIWDIEIDFFKETVKKWEQNIYLSNLEFNLLKYFIENRQRVIDRVELLENVWGEFDRLMFSRTVDIYVWYLRKKLWQDFIKTRKWSWYILE